MNYVLNQLWIEKEVHNKKNLLVYWGNKITLLKKAAEKRRKLFFDIKFQRGLIVLTLAPTYADMYIKFSKIFWTKIKNLFKKQ
jgi:hypothetical protein